MEDELRLVFEAEAEAKEMISKAERRAAAIRSEARAESEKLKKSSRDQALKEGEKIVARRVAEADKDGRELEAQQRERIGKMEAEASPRIKDAAELILKSMLEGT